MAESVISSRSVDVFLSNSSIVVAEPTDPALQKATKTPASKFDSLFIIKSLRETREPYPVQTVYCRRGSVAEVAGCRQVRQSSREQHRGSGVDPTSTNRPVLTAKSGRFLWN